MEPKDPNKKFEDVFKSIIFTYNIKPGNIHAFHNKETVEQIIARYNEVDETVDAMTEYPQAKKMLDKLYGNK